jgi:hypothetical protein
VVFTVTAVENVSAVTRKWMAGEKVQVVSAGRFPQLNWTTPVKPLRDFMLMTSVAASPARMVADGLFDVNAKSGEPAGLTTCVSGADVELAKPVLPENVAVMLCCPVVSCEVVNVVAAGLLTEGAKTIANGVPLSFRVMDPLCGIAVTRDPVNGDETVAVKVTGSPNPPADCDEVRFTVVGAGLTTAVSGAELLGALVFDPL